MAEELKAKIVALGDEIRELKAKKADPGAQIAELLRLKAEYKTTTGEDYVAPGQVKKPKEPKQAAPKEKKEAGPKKEKADALTPEQRAKIAADKEAKEKAKADKKKGVAAPAPAPAASTSTQPMSAADIAAEVKARKGTALERTYIMIKPDGVQRNLVGEIIERFERRGFRLGALKMKRPPRAQLEAHYADLKKKPFFAGLVEYMASGPVVCMVWEGLDAVSTGRKMLGETKPLESAPGTIRGDLCLDIGRNICHGSDSVESAESEIALWFGRGELLQFDPCAASWIYEAAPSAAAGGVAGASDGHHDSAIRPPDGDKFYITTAINYTNGPPHMGHAYEAVTTDAIARYHRVYGRQVFFLTGTDEHGEKIATTAESKGLKPIDICNKWATEFQALNGRLGVSNDFYIRTSMDKHKKLAQLVYTKAKEAGDIYKGEYEGWYNPKEEAFVTENEAQEMDYKDPSTGNPLIKRKESSYFFRQSKYQKQLVDHITANPHFVMPEIRRNEILARLTSDGKTSNDQLRDLSISRTTFEWGIPLPDDPEHVMYVWFDALTNYLSGVDYPGGPNSHFWPAQIQIIGKDIVWFHCVIWPCMLMSAGIPLPKTVFAHGFVNDANNKKMSKSEGNVVDPNKILDKYSSDAMRFFLMRESGFGTDLPFSEDSLIERFNTELANTFGNAVHRGVNLCVKYTDGKVPDVDVDRPFDLNALRDAVENAYAQVRIHDALEHTLEATRELNKYLTEKEPWKMKDASQERERAVIVRTVLECAYVLTHFLDPYVPRACAAVIEEVHTALMPIRDLNANFKNLKVGTPVHVGEVLFKKIEKPKPQKTIQTVDLRVAEILEAKPHPSAPTLWILQIHSGSDKRQVCAGIKAFYPEAEKLVGRRVLLAANLKSIKLKGEASDGMVLCGESGGKFSLVDPGQQSAVGSFAELEGFPQILGDKKIDVKVFSTLDFAIKAQQVLCDGLQLKINDTPVTVDAPDGAKVK